MINCDKKILTKKTPLSIAASIIVWIILMLGCFHENNIYVNIFSFIILILDILSCVLETLIYKDYKVFREDKYFIWNCYIGIVEGLSFMLLFAFMEIDYITIFLWILFAWSINTKAKIIDFYKNKE